MTDAFGNQLPDTVTLDATGATDTGGNTQPPDLTASTGANDPTSVWYTGLLQTALQTGTSLGVSAADRALTNALGLQSPVTAPSSGGPGASGSPTAQAQAHAAAAFGSPGSKTLWYVLGGAAVLILGWLLLRER